MDFIGFGMIFKLKLQRVKSEEKSTDLQILINIHIDFEIKKFYKDF